VLSSVRAQTYSLPSGRGINWQVSTGIPGGIPTNYTQFCNVLQSIPGTNIVAIGDGIADDYPALNAAITLCPAYGIVYLPAGKYAISQSLKYENKSNFILRGAASTNTTIVLTGTGTDAAIWIYTTGWSAIGNQTANILSGATKGSTNLVLDSVPLYLNTNSLLIIDQLNDTTNVTGLGVGGTCTVCDRPGNATRNLSQYAAITSVNGSNVTIWPPLNMSFNPALAPQAQTWTSFMTGIGIENLCISNTSPNSVGNLALYDLYHCWVKNVESVNVLNYHLQLIESLQCVVRDSYFHVGNSGYGNGLAYGVEVDKTTDSLFENNIFNQLTFGLAIEKGGSGNVAGYNYFVNMIADPTNTLSAGLVTGHGAHSTMNLYEGNIADEAQSDFYWGSSGPVTLYRNWLTGNDAGVTQYRATIRFDNHSLSNNVVGNILGSPGLFWGYDDGQSPSLPLSTNLIYRLGYPNIGNNNYSGFGFDTNNLDTRVQATLLRHGNYDYATASVVWSNGVNQTLPASLYLTGKPSWFGNLPWPPFDPANPGNAAVTNLPAGYRFVLGTGPPQTRSAYMMFQIQN